MDDVTQGPGNLVATPSVYRSRFVPLPASLARYAALFYASEVVRYHPARSIRRRTRLLRGYLSPSSPRFRFDYLRRR